MGLVSWAVESYLHNNTTNLALISIYTRTFSNLISTLLHESDLERSVHCIKAHLVLAKTAFLQTDKILKIVMVFYRPDLENSSSKKLHEILS